MSLVSVLRTVAGLALIELEQAVRAAAARRRRQAEWAESPHSGTAVVCSECGDHVAADAQSMAAHAREHAKP